ncbi:hypothetical protein OB920_18890 [Halobacteria archaeon HArc-gm2]|nr:hypothetical protein [Halobacteria archaeon HArc-gm2]
MTPTTQARQTTPADVRGPPITTFDDTAGLVDDIALLEPAVIDPLVDPASVVQTHGVLVHEPTGIGKSWLATALLGEFVVTEFTPATFDAVAPSPDIVAKFQDSLESTFRESPRMQPVCRWYSSGASTSDTRGRDGSRKW